MELVAFSLLMVLLVSVKPKNRGTGFGAKTTKPSFFLPFSIFISLILLQMVPMPPTVLKVVSPKTYELYRETVDGYGSGRDQPSRFSVLQMDEKGGVATVDWKDRVGLPRDELVESKGLFHDWRSLTIYPHATRVELLKILAYAATFGLLLGWADSRGKLLRLLYLMIVMGSLLSVIGMFQRFVGAEEIYGLWKPVFRTDQSFFGPYVNPNHFAGYVALIIPVAAALLIREVERMGRGRVDGQGNHRRRFNDQNFHVALFLLLALVLMVSGLFLSLSRGGIVAFTGSILFLVAVISVKEGWRWMIGLALAIGLFAALFLFWLGFVPFQVEVKTLENLLQDSNVQTRMQIWKDGLKMLIDFPLFGTGLGTFAHLYPKYKTLFGQATVMYPENDFFQVLIETGLLGFGLLGWFFVAFFKDLWGRWRRHDMYKARINPKVMVGLMAAMVAMVIHGVGDFNLHIPANALQFAIVMGLAMRLKTENIYGEAQ